MNNNKNILLDVTNRSFLTMASNIKLTSAFLQKIPISHSQLKTLVYQSDEIRNLIEEICRQHIPKFVVQKEVLDILHEIGYSYDLFAVRFLGLLIVKILKKTLSGLHVNENKLISIKSEMGDCPVVFVPTHRSYGDFILMAFVCFHYRISIPAVAAGKDFLSMKFMSKMLRNTKAFFLRRTFSDDPLYRNVFKKYIQLLISQGESPVEFFIEGTRSRTAKSLMPKFGFLTMLMEAYFLRDIPDIKFIPVNISYDRILEENLFARELIGIPKPKESTMGLIKALNVLKGNYGKIFVKFGDPISLRSFFPEEKDSRYDSNEREKIKGLAYCIIDKQQSLQTFSCFNLLALIIHNSIIGSGSTKVSLEQAIEEFKWLLIIFEKYSADVYFDGQIEEALKNTMLVHDSLVELSESKYVNLKIDTTERREIHSLSGKTLEDSKKMLNTIPFMMLQIYVNPSINLFGRATILVTVLKYIYKTNETTCDILFEDYKYLCDLLKYEFVLNNNGHKEFHDNILRLVDIDVIKKDDNSIRLNINYGTQLFIYLIQPFLISIFSFCLFLHEAKNSILTGKQSDILKMAQKFNLGILRTNETDYYSLCIDSISNTFGSFLEMGIILRSETIDASYVINQKALDKATKYLSWLVSKGKYLDSQESYMPQKEQLRAKF